MRRISEEKQNAIRTLRLRGKSIPEISSMVRTSKTTVQRYVLHVEVPKKYESVLREKQGGSKERAIGLRKNIATNARVSIGKLSSRDRLLILVGLYWGEGTKKDFDIINSDPFLIQTVLCSLMSLGIDSRRLSLSLRVHSDISVSGAKRFWSQATGLPVSRIGRVEVIEGKKKGKLPHGMCRVRVTSGIRERLFIQSAIEYIGKDCSKRVLSHKLS